MDIVSSSSHPKHHFMDLHRMIVLNAPQTPIEIMMGSVFVLKIGQARLAMITLANVILVVKDVTVLPIMTVKHA